MIVHFFLLYQAYDKSKKKKSLISWMNNFDVIRGI